MSIASDFTTDLTKKTGIMYKKPSFLQMRSGKRNALMTIVILLMAAVLAFLVRLFSVVKYESVIHEYDPYFNYRTTLFLTEKGFYNFHNWFDEKAWYPLGRIIGGTIFPGLMMTSATIYHILQFLNVTIDVRNVCVFMAPLFSSFTTVVTYYLTKEIKDAGSGLFAAALISIVPGYISRSIAGSYDNEAISIFCMLLTFYMWIKAVKTGRVYWSAMTVGAYFYMVSSWGGYVFIINLIPLHVCILMITGRFTSRIYVAYSSFYCLGVIISMQIPFVGFQPVQSSEHMTAFAVFGICQLYVFVFYLRSNLSEEHFNVLCGTIFFTFSVIFIGIGLLLVVTGKISPWTGRFYTLLDPSYAKNNIPIIASVSEHQPTAWSSFYFDLQLLVFLFPVGLYDCFSKLTEANIFILVYGLTSIYFTGVMVRLMLVLAPVMCIMSGIGMSSILTTHCKQFDTTKKSKTSKRFHDRNSQSKGTAITLTIVMILLLMSYINHCTWVTSNSYSSPSIIVYRWRYDDSMVVIDDYREAYYWLKHNTPGDAKIMSWWDYGYQISAVANRTVLVDNNTWNNTHISRVGQAMASTEEEAYKIMRELDVDYVLVVFGGYVKYSSDDINKFLWMVRIGADTEQGSTLREVDYLTSDGYYRIGEDGAPKLLNCLMYKLSYYKFGNVYTEHQKPSGYDRVRETVIGNKDFELNMLEEAFTTENWMVRIYKVKNLRNRV